MLDNHTNRELQLLFIGDYLFEPKVGSLSGPSGTHHICSQRAAVLRHLIEQSNEVVDRDYLINEIWPDDPKGSHSLTRCIRHLRAYFGDTAKAADYIETVPNHGYRLTARVYGNTRKRVPVDPASHSSENTRIGSHVYRLLQEFRDRKVCRSMLIYTMVIWLIFQVSEIIVPALNLPDWVNRLVIVLGLLGFPAAATLSWIFNLTPSGVVRDPKSASTPHSALPRSRTELAFDSALILIALGICGMLAFVGFG